MIVSENDLREIPLLFDPRYLQSRSFRSRISRKRNVSSNRMVLEHLGPQEANSEGGEDDDDWYDNIIGLNGKKRHKSNNYLISCDSSATDAKLSELPP